MSPISSLEIGELRDKEMAAGVLLFALIIWWLLD